MKRYLEVGDILCGESRKEGRYVVTASNGKEGFTIKCIKLPENNISTMKLERTFSYRHKDLSTVRKLLKKWWGFKLIPKASEAANILFGDKTSTPQDENK